MKYIRNMSKETKVNIRKWFISSGVTFLSGAGLVLLASWDSITLQSFKDGSIVGLGFLVVRAGAKGLVEAFLRWRGLM